MANKKNYKLIIVKMDIDSYNALGVGSEDSPAWDYPIDELDYLLETAQDERRNIKLALIGDRLYELDV